MTAKKVAELRELLTRETKAEWVGNLWDKYYQQKQDKMREWAEIQKYISATDTTKTANSHLPWTHKTVYPKLTQIRDNLHANYLSGLFPNDKWLSWVAYSKDAAKKEVANTIKAYMENKTREGGLRNTVSLLLYDYIDKGNAFAYPTFEVRYKRTEDRTPSFIGPKACRIDPNDIVFNPLASSFEDTFKIVRSFKTIGELKKIAEENPDQTFWKEALERREFIREALYRYTTDQWQKAEQYHVDGFGNLHEYYSSNTVEVLEFFGDYHDSATGELSLQRMVTVVDRAIVVRDVPIDSYGGEALIRSVGWRYRPDNLWSAGPLDQLVGMQYLLDHYINMGANALDLKIMPPKKVIGEVEPFEWAPNAEIHIDEGGSDVQEMAQQFGDVYTVRDWIEHLENKMELYAGAPREAMGIRTPGEKTAFEVQVLENAASRIFTEKIIQFELFLELILNDMLETAHKNLNITDTIRVIDNDIGVQQFLQITKEDIVANGILRPVGARHFAQKANELQNLVGVFSSPIGESIRPHVSSKDLARFVEDVLDLRGYSIFKPYVALEEQQEMEMLSAQMQEDNIMAQQISEEEALGQGI